MSNATVDFAGAAQSGDHHELFPRNLQIDVFKIVLSRAVNVNRAIPLRVGRPLAAGVHVGPLA
jgi:hypothetical protein